MFVLRRQEGYLKVICCLLEKIIEISVEKLFCCEEIVSLKETGVVLDNLHGQRGRDEEK